MLHSGVAQDQVAFWMGTAKGKQMSKSDDTAEDEPFEPEIYEALRKAATQALAKVTLATEQLAVIRSTLDSGLPQLKDSRRSEEARAACEIFLLSAQILSSIARSNLWEAADMISAALGDDEEDEDTEEE